MGGGAYVCVHAEMTGQWMITGLTSRTCVSSLHTSHVWYVLVEVLAEVLGTCMHRSGWFEDSCLFLPSNVVNQKPKTLIQ